MNIEFSSSELGTKKFWDKSYKQELKNFEDHGDVGDIWYGEDSAIRLVKWMKTHKDDVIPLSTSILDIGCGNGMVLNYLADEGYQNLNGVDYSEKAITLAKSIANKRDTNISYQVGDIVSDQLNKELSKEYSICIDRGTYDAISLNPDSADVMMESYIKNVHKILSDGGFFIITSCNWMEEELIQHFNQYFTKYETIPTPLFEFGGRVGTKYTCLVLNKKATADSVDEH